MRRSGKIYAKLAGFFSAFVALAIIVAMVWKSEKDHLDRSGKLDPQDGRELRLPASVLYDDDGEPVFWSSDGASETHDRGAAIFSLLANLSPDQATHVSGVKALRGRRVMFHLRAFLAAVRRFPKDQPKWLALPLFADTVLTVRLNPPSAYGVNAGVYTGQVDRDEDSIVRLFAASGASIDSVDGVVTGTIETGRRRFRILDSGSLNQEIIIEEDLR